jgi:hypothetical protein
VLNRYYVVFDFEMAAIFSLAALKYTISNLFTDYSTNLLTDYSFNPKIADVNLIFRCRTDVTVRFVQT